MSTTRTESTSSAVDDAPTRRGWSVVGYAAAVIVVAAALFAVYAVVGSAGVGWAVATPVVLFAGAVGALVQTFRARRAGSPRAGWHGAAWVLIVLTVLAVASPLLTLSAIK